MEYSVYTHSPPPISPPPIPHTCPCFLAESAPWFPVLPHLSHAASLFVFFSSFFVFFRVFSCFLVCSTSVYSSRYARGGHLLCHDDVIGSRCVSYILYLSRPGKKWRPEMGGALELYPLAEGGVPEAAPSRVPNPPYPPPPYPTPPTLPHP